MSAEEHVRRSIGRYFQSLDNNDVDGFVSVFDENARVIHGNEEVAGKEAIREWISRLFSNPRPNRFSKHISGNIVITVDGESAQSITDVAVLRSDENPWRVMMVTRHHDRLIPQADGTWRFIEKRIEQIGSS